MRKASLSFRVTLTVLLSLALGASAQAQATRTWVSGVGDDANPCSRTAPCKTFAGAISKTAAGGEINTLDPGGFGAVTITKAITIANDGTGSAGVLVSGTNAIVINAPTNAVVILRGLDIEGLGTGLNGIRFIAGGALHVENCTINNFAQKGIDFQPTNTAQLFVKDTIIRNNINAMNGGGILVKPSGALTLANAMLENVQLRNNLFGLRVEANGRVTAKNTTAASNINSGFVTTSIGAAANLFLDGCVSTNNGGNGIASDGASANVRISNCTITTNTGTGLAIANSGKIFSFGNNRNDGNIAGNGVPTAPVVSQQ